jgi:hypothetical protein
MDAYVFGSPEGNTGDTRDFLQAQAEKGLPGLTLRARLDFLEGSIGGGIFFQFLLGLLVLLVLVVGDDFFNVGGHLIRRLVHL